MGSFDNKSPGLEGYASSAEAPEAGYSQPIKRGRWSLAVAQEPSSFAATPNASNADFDPIPPSKRTWGSGSFVAYWMADAWAVSNWEVGESLEFTEFVLSCWMLTVLCSIFNDRCWFELEDGDWRVCSG